MSGSQVSAGRGRSTVLAGATARNASRLRSLSPRTENRLLRHATEVAAQGRARIQSRLVQVAAGCLL